MFLCTYGLLIFIYVATSENSIKFSQHSLTQASYFRLDCRLINKVCLLAFCNPIIYFPVMHLETYSVYDENKMTV